MSPLKISLIAVVISTLVTTGGLYRHQQGRLREARHLQAQNNRLRLEANQRVHDQSAAVPRPAPTPQAMTDRPALVAAPVSPEPEHYRNEGNATPRAALQTFAWACDRGDIEAVGRILYIEEAARPKVAAFIAALPENVRSRWKSADEIVAALLTESVMARPFPRADILETATPEEAGAGRIRLRMPNVPRDGTEYQQTAEGWKYVLTEKVVDAYIQQARQTAR